MISDFRAKEHDGEGARLHHDGGRGHRGGHGSGGVLAFSRKAAAKLASTRAIVRKKRFRSSTHTWGPKSSKTAAAALKDYVPSGT